MNKNKPIKANDARIPLAETNVVSRRKITLRGSSKVQTEIENVCRDGKDEKRKIIAHYKLLLNNKFLTKEQKKEIKKSKKQELYKNKYEFAKKQALVYADSQNQKIPDGLSISQYSRIADRAFLPQYTRGEDIFSAVAHFAGGGLAIVMLILGMVLSSVYQGITNRALAVGGAFIFGFSAIVLYAISSIYHFLWVNKAKKIFRIFDHSSIYILIAGSYTPFCMYGAINYAYGSNNNMYGWILLGIEWGVGILLIVLNCLWIRSKLILGISITGYIILGWGIIAFLPQLIINLGIPAFSCLVAGGIVYTIGAIMFGAGPKIKYMHGISHIMYVIGTILHFLTLCFLLTGVGNPANLLIR